MRSKGPRILLSPRFFSAWLYIRGQASRALSQARHMHQTSRMDRSGPRMLELPSRPAWSLHIVAAFFCRVSPQRLQFNTCHVSCLQHSSMFEICSSCPKVPYSIGAGARGKSANMALVDSMAEAALGYRRMLRNPCEFRRVHMFVEVFGRWLLASAQSALYNGSLAVLPGLLGYTVGHPTRADLSACFSWFGSTSKVNYIIMLLVCLSCWWRGILCRPLKLLNSGMVCVCSAHF